MLKELFELVRGQATETVINNPAVPNEQNNEVVAEATNTVASGLRNIVAGGGVQNLLAMFNSGGNKQSLLNNPIVSMMIGHFAGKLMNKFGMDNTRASQVSGSLIPDVMSGLINKTNDPNEKTFSLEGLLGSITGNKTAGNGQGGGLQDILGKLTGSAGNNDAGGGIMDLIQSMAGGAQQQQQRNGGGLLDLIKGFAK